MFAATLFISGLCVLVALLWFNQRRKQQPGYGSQKPVLVPGLPLLGNVFSVDRKRPHISLTALAEQYGAVYRIKLFGKEIVVVNNLDTITEVLNGNGNTFAGRPYFFRIDYGFHGSKDVIFGTYSSKWAYMKKITAQFVRQFATGHDNVERIVQEEMTSLVERITEHDGKDFDPAMDTLTAVVNAISASMIGKRYAHNDARMLHYKRITRLFSQACSVSEGAELDVFPWLRHLPNQSFRRLTEATSLLDEFIDEELTERKKMFDPMNVSCILDALLSAQTETESNTKGHDITKDDVRAIFIDILVSSTFTTSVTMNAFLLYMAHYPHIQSRLQQELDQHLGPGQLPESQLRSKMHLMEAAILETLRLISHVPLCLPHMATEDATIGGYRVAKNTDIFVNLWSLHHSETLWPDPWSFSPDRFLDQQGCLLAPTHRVRKSLFPFGAGKRMCIGEKLARDRIFMYLAVILQKFTICPPESASLQSCDPRDFQLGLILEPSAFTISVKTREETC